MTTKEITTQDGAPANSMPMTMLDERELLRVLEAVKRGDFTARMNQDGAGTPVRIASALNDIIELQEQTANEIARLGRVVGKEGKINERAMLHGAAGGWVRTIDAVNDVVSDLAQPLKEVTHVIDAVAKGDLSQHMDMHLEDRPLKGEFRSSAKLVNTMVDQLAAFASEVTRVAREVGSEGKLGGQADVPSVSGTWKDLTDNVNSMADNLTAQVREIAEVTTAVANGDLSKKITVDVKGEILELKNTINTMVDQLSSFASEVTRVAREVGSEGKLGGQADVPGVSGTWKDLTDNVNSMADNLTAQVREIAEVTTAVANGDLSKKITVDVKGEILELKNTINTMVDQLSSFASEVTRVAREVGTEGELGGQADVPGVSGTWKDLTDNVNSMAGNLTAQVREIAEVTTAVANGDLSKKITVDVKGEILELKNTINTMVDQLSSFASEVTRVAREVGTEGKLGGQAGVPGVAGVWKDLTDNVNSMADNLTAQVREIAEVTTAVANGDLSKKITVDVKGEIFELKNTINSMIDTLAMFADQVTTVAREVGTEGKLGGQADVPGVSGTWKDLTDNVNSMADNLTAQVREIAEVTTAVANGDLSKKITVDVKGEILELKDTINTMVDQLSSFASEVTRVAREVGTEGKLGGQADVPGVSGTWKDLTDNVNSMADNLTAQVREIAEVTTAVANGDLSKKITVDVKGEIQELKNTINTMVDQLNGFASEVTRVAREVGTEGELGGQADVPGVSGTWKDLTDNVNSMAGNLTAQVREIAEVTTAVANGDLSKKITVDVKGEILELKNTINTMVDQLSSFASEVTRVAREVGTEGKLGGQAGVPGVAGVWKDLTDNVNSMAGNLTAQVRGIATVVTAVARGELDQKLSVDAKGEIAELADTINSMIDTLARFADQVTTVAREVGIEGKLGGQANVPGASGTWKDLTDNVNRLAANLTTQVRAIIEVTTAVAVGDLSKKITVEAAGEVAFLKDNVNKMIRTLKETTLKTNEQDWLKTNLTKFTQLLQGQKELVPVAKLILSQLAPLVNMQHGVFYLTDKPEEVPEPELRLLSSYAYRERRSLSNRFKLGEGLVGQCALERERILLTNVPSDYVQINSGLGAASPLNIVVLPVLFEGEVKAVIELASFHEFKPIHLNFLDQLTTSFGIVLNTIEANMRTESLLIQSQTLTQELTETNKRLEQQAQSLQTSEELLRHQQEELQQTNTELEEKARLLQEQKAEVEHKNRQIELARQDIEEKAEQLALTSKYKSEFLANMSHELRTPLNSMLILSKMLAENGDGNLDSKQVEFADTIYTSGADLLALINEILDLSKIESGTMGVQIGRVGLNKLTNDIDRQFRELARDKGLAFDISIDDALPQTIRTDEKRLQQVLKNLLSNAFKFTDQGSVSLDVHCLQSDHDKRFDRDELKSDDVIAFTVRDTGIGISRDKHRVIFEAFQQADGTTSRIYDGTGLGLSISREISRLLGGEIHLESEIGEGAEFTLFLPFDYRPPQEEQLEEEELSTLSERSFSKMTEVFNARRLPVANNWRQANGEGEQVDSVSKLLRTTQPNRSLSRGGEGSERVRPATQARTSLTSPHGSSNNLHAGRFAQDGAMRSLNDRSRYATPSSGAEVVRDTEREPSTPNGRAKAWSKEEAGAPSVDMLQDDRTNLEEGDRVLLVVEDDPMYARLLMAAARRKGFKVLLTSHAETALMLARRYEPDAITLDLQLPGMHGLSLLDRLKHEHHTRHIPIQILTVADDIPRRKRRGAVRQLRKPVTPEALDASLDEMREFVERKERRLLIVEDDDTVCEHLGKLLGSDSVEIDVSKTYAGAIERLKEQTYDCCIIDLTLPDGSGLDLVAELRSELDLQDLPVVVHTSRDLDNEAREFCNEHVDAVIPKDMTSVDKLLNETVLFLHRAEYELRPEQQWRLTGLRRPENDLADKHVLIIDDDVRNIFAITSLLERHKMNVTYAESGEDGVAYLRDTANVDIVLMDMMMPGMDGYETTQEVRKLEALAHLPIIAVTAKAMPGDREKCLQAGCSDYLTKPINIEQLLSLLRVWTLG